MFCFTIKKYFFSWILNTVVFLGVDTLCRVAKGKSPKKKRQRLKRNQPHWGWALPDSWWSPTQEKTINLLTEPSSAIYWCLFMLPSLLAQIFSLQTLGHIIFSCLFNWTEGFVGHKLPRKRLRQRVGWVFWIWRDLGRLRNPTGQVAKQRVQATRPSPTVNWQGAVRTERPRVLKVRTHKNLSCTCFHVQMYKKWLGDMRSASHQLPC